MSLQFYFGSSGAGKSKQLHKDLIHMSMKEPGTNFLILVPDQFTMQTQMDLVSEHPDKGIMNIDVLSFGRLAHRIFGEVGRSDAAVLDDTGKSLVLRKVAAGLAGRLPVIGGSLRKNGYIHEVKSSLSEFMQYGVGLKELRELEECARAGRRGALAGKLADMGQLYQGFLDYIRGKYVTTEETLGLLCEALQKSEIVRNSVVAFDGFTGFTPVQNRVIRELLRLARRVIVTVILDGRENPYVQDGEQKLFHLSKKTVADLDRLAQEAEAGREKDRFLCRRPEDQAPRFADNPEMEHLERNIFRYPIASYAGENRAIHLFEASAPGEEVRQVCIRLREMIRESGYCYRDFAVVTGDPQTYGPYVESEFPKYDIPYFLDRTKGILLNPFIEYIRSALKILLKDYDYESVFHYLRSGLADFTPEETDRLENYVLARGIRGRRRWNTPFVRRMKAADDDESARMEELNRLRERLTGQLASLPVCGNRPVGELVRALYGFIADNDVQRKLSRYEEQFDREGDPSRAREYGQIYRLVMDLLDQIYSLLEEETITLQEFADLLDAGFGEIQVGAIPQNVDRVVVGDIERTRLKQVKILFFLGVNEGNIPKNTGGGGLISDIDREFLMNSGIELAPAPRQKMYIERLYLYMNMTKPADCLILSYAKVSREGKSARPAYLVDHLKRLFPALRVEKPENEPLITRIQTPLDGLDCYTLLLRRYADGKLDASQEREFYTLHHLYREQEGYAERVERLTGEAFRRYEDRPLSREVARALYGTSLENSVSRLERYAACGYAHFLEYGLMLREREGYTFEAADMGNVFHGVLESFAGKLAAHGKTWFDFTKEEGEAWLAESLEEYAARYGETILYSSARNEYALKRMERILRRTVFTLQRQLIKGSFVPEQFEMSFSMTQDLETVNIALTDREKMKLRGRIDRLDTYEDSDHVYVKVIDYKSGNKKFDLAALYYGLQLQLVVYMNVALELEKKKHPDKEAVPAALLYYHVADPMLRSDEPLSPEQINEKLLQELRMTGLVNEDDTVVGLLDRDFTDKSSVVPIERKKDGSYTSKSCVINRKDFQTISDYVNLKIRKFGAGILGGNIPVNPYGRAGASPGPDSACTYCPYQAVCGFDGRVEGYRGRQPERQEEEILLARMKEELEEAGT